MKSIFITGATGFIGSNLIKELSSSQKFNKQYTFICLVRESSDISKLNNLKKFGVKIAKGDIKDYNSFDSYLKNVDIVIHCAANLGYINRKLLYKDNVNGTSNLVKAAEKHKIRQFIHISSVAAARTFVKRHKSIPIKIHSQTTSQTSSLTSLQEHKEAYLGRYGNSKRLAEKVLMTSTLNYTILRPCMVVGKNSQDYNNFNKFSRLIKKLPVMPITGSGNNHLQIVHVNDVVKGIINSIGNKKASKQIYYLCNKPIKYKNYIKLIAKMMNKSIFILPLPPFVVIILGNIYEIIFGKKIISKDGVLGLIYDSRFDTTKTTQDLNFMPMSNVEAVKRSL